MNARAARRAWKCAAACCPDSSLELGQAVARAIRGHPVQIVTLCGLGSACLRGTQHHAAAAAGCQQDGHKSPLRCSACWRLQEGQHVGSKQRHGARDAPARRHSSSKGAGPTQESLREESAKDAGRSARTRLRLLLRLRPSLFCGSSSSCDCCCFCFLLALLLPPVSKKDM